MHFTLANSPSSCSMAVCVCVGCWRTSGDDCFQVHGHSAGPPARLVPVPLRWRSILCRSNFHKKSQKVCWPIASILGSLSAATGGVRGKAVHLTTFSFRLSLIDILWYCFYCSSYFSAPHFLVSIMLSCLFSWAIKCYCSPGFCLRLSLHPTICVLPRQLPHTFYCWMVLKL